MAASRRTLTCPECGTPYLSGAKFCAHCGKLVGRSELELDGGAASLPAGTLVGSYRVIDVLGEGGMGRVYLAEHTKLGRRVAIKKLRPELASNPASVARFFAEARAVNRISHENIVEITDLIEEPRGDNYIIMELLQGEDLRQRLARHQRLPLSRALDIGAQTASALAAVHAADMVHRDLKPDNIFLIDRRGNPDFVKVLDFGVAKLTDAGAARGLGSYRTAAGQIIGTPEYMSPEQASGGSVDHRTDIYALGVIMYEMITGELPFQAKTFGELMIKHMSSPVVLPAPRPGLPPGVTSARDQLLLDLLAKDPNDRPASMREVELQLRALVDAMELPPPPRRSSTSGHGAVATAPTPQNPAARSGEGSSSAEAVARVALIRRPTPRAAAVELTPPRSVSRIEVVTSPGAGGERSGPRAASPGIEQHASSVRPPLAGAQSPDALAGPWRTTASRAPTAEPEASERGARLAEDRASGPVGGVAERSAPRGGWVAGSSPGIAAPAPAGGRPTGDLVKVIGSSPGIATPAGGDDHLDPASAAATSAVPRPASVASTSRAARSRRTLVIVGALGIVGVAAIWWFAVRAGDRSPSDEATAVRSAEVKIKFVSGPPGATVRLAGATSPLGITPFTQGFPRSARGATVEISKQGFATLTQDVSLAADDAVAVVLTPLVTPPPEADTPGPPVQAVQAVPAAPVSAGPAADTSAAPKPAPPRRVPAKRQPPPAPDRALDRNGTLDVFKRP